MRNNLLKTAAALSILFFLSSNLPAQEAYNLQYKFEKGKTHLYNADIASKMTQEVMGKEMKVDSDIHSVIRFSIDNVADNGDIDITSSLDSASVKSVMMGKETNMNIPDMIGKRVKAVLSNTGEIRSCTMIDSVSEKYSKMMPLTQEVKRFFTKLAGKEIKIGESWSSTTVDTIASLGGGVTNSTEMTSTLSGKETKLGYECFKIPVSGKLKISGKSNIQGMDFAVEGEGTSSGTLYLDVKTGLLIYSEATLNIDMTMATSGQQSMVIPITQNMKYTQTLINN